VLCVPTFDGRKREVDALELARCTIAMFNHTCLPPLSLTLHTRTTTCPLSLKLKVRISTGVQFVSCDKPKGPNDLWEVKVGFIPGAIAQYIPGNSVQANVLVDAAGARSPVGSALKLEREAVKGSHQWLGVVCHFKIDENFDENDEGLPDNEAPPLKEFSLTRKSVKLQELADHGYVVVPPPPPPPPTHTHTHVHTHACTHTQHQPSRFHL
jgi:hypothetical protein